MSKTNIDESKRKFIKRASYVAPAVITMAALPSFASAGSRWSRDKKHGHRHGRGNRRGRRDQD